MFFKKKKFNLYKLFVKFKIRWLLYFFIKRDSRFIRAKLSMIKQPFKFSNELSVGDYDIVVWFQKYLKLICGKKFVTRRQLAINLKKYCSKTNYRLVTGYVRRLHYLTYLSAINKLIIFFRLVWLKNTKLLIFFQRRRWNYFFNFRKNKFDVFTKNQNCLLKKFIS